FFLQDYDRNRDGHLDPTELARAERNLHREWRRHGFFSLWQGRDRPFRIYRADSFHLTFDPNSGLKVQARLQPPEPFRETFTVALFDPDYFHNLEPGADPVLIEGQPQVDVLWHPRINRQITFYYGQLHPLELAFQLVPTDHSPRLRGPDFGPDPTTPPDLTLPTWEDDPSSTPGESPAMAPEPPTEPPPTGVVFAQASSPGGWAGWLRWLNFQQQAVREWMADLRLQAQETNQTSPYLWMMLASFLYGIIHAAGPGHGKAALAAYFAGGQVARWQACAVAAGTAFLHAGSGMALVWIVHGLLDEAVQGVLPDATRWTQTLSASLILLLGLFLAWQAWRRWTRPTPSSSTPPPRRRSWLIMLAVGLVPCPATVLVFLFCLSFNAPGLGIALVLALAGGMATCLIAVALVASLLGQSATALARPRTGALRAAAGIDLVAATLLALIGTLLLAAALAALSPGWA
ncbi:MAG: hypothetical protein SNJ84_08850, partial [Verrucomicrobiia bacterium]